MQLPAVKKPRARNLRPFIYRTAADWRRLRQGDREMNLMFGFSGRIGRLQWWLGQLAIVGVLFFGAILVYMSIDSSISPSSREAAHLSASAMVVIGAAILLAT